MSMTSNPMEYVSNELPPRTADSGSKDRGWNRPSANRDHDASASVVVPPAPDPDPDPVPAPAPAPAPGPGASSSPGSSNTDLTFRAAMEPGKSTMMVRGVYVGWPPGDTPSLYITSESTASGTSSFATRSASSCSSGHTAGSRHADTQTRRRHPGVTHCTNGSGVSGCGGVGAPAGSSSVWRRGWSTRRTAESAHRGKAASLEMKEVGRPYAPLVRLCVCRYVSAASESAVHLQLKPIVTT